jgi:NDP-sugar pyrophosphorylase family protein
MSFRKLTKEEIAFLESRDCTAKNWDSVEVHEAFNPRNVSKVTFSGNIKIGKLDSIFTFAGGLEKPAGLHNLSLHNCELGDNVLIENVQNYIANYIIGSNTQIQNVDRLVTDERSTFGNGVEATVLNETGGREVMINDKLTAHVAYVLSLYRHRPTLIQSLRRMIRFYAEKHASETGTIGENVRIINSGLIRNVKIGNHAHIEGIRRLENGSINSNEYDPVHIGYGVIAEDFIICSGSQVDDGAMLTRCFVGQSCRLGHAYSASDSLFFSNCQGENGEACAIFAGPYTVTHHKSTLLIAGMFSFMNAGSGSNQSNHMYKLGPIHQGIIERGGKTASDSYILWPAKIGAFSLIMGRHYRNSDTSNMPFSYLIENKDETVLAPGVNLRSVGTIRDAKKFPKRDKRKDPNKLDQINFNLLSPYTIQKMFRAIGILHDLQESCGYTSEYYTYQSCKIKNTSLKKGIDLYNIAIKKFLGNSIISRLKNFEYTHIDDVKKRLKPDTPDGLGEWLDMAGLIAPKAMVDQLLNDIESGKINKLSEINHVLEEIHRNYYSLEWTWAWDKIQSYYNCEPDMIMAYDIIHIVEDWKQAVVRLDRILYEDAKKEFSLSSQTGFGADGNNDEQRLDFEQVRGVFEQNTFVSSILQHIEEKTLLGDSLIRKMKKIASDEL